MAMVPIWFPIEGFPNYEVSDTGLIRHKITKQLISKSLDNGGYVKINMRKDGKQYTRTVHRIVAIARLPNLENKREVNHKNGVKTDNLPGSLEWVTAKENMRHAHDTGLKNMDQFEDYQRRRREATHCKRGHRITGTNSLGNRFCVECNKASQRRWAKRNRGNAV